MRHLNLYTIIEYTLSQGAVSQIKIKDTMENVIQYSHSALDPDTKYYLPGKPRNISYQYDSLWTLTLNGETVRTYYSFVNPNRTDPKRGRELMGVSNELGELTTYKTQINASKFNAIIPTPNSNDGQYGQALLTEVKYPTGQIIALSYKTSGYDRFNISGYTGSSHINKYEDYYTINNGSANYRYTKNRITYTIGDHTGYYEYVGGNGEFSSKAQHDRVRQVAPTETDPDLTAGRYILKAKDEIYTYNTKGLLTGKETALPQIIQDEEIKSYDDFNNYSDVTIGTQEKVTYTYNGDGLVTKQSIQRFTLPGSSNSNTITYQYSYDKKGNLLTETSPNGQKVTYTYDPTYSIPLTKTYKQDASTTIVETNTLTTDKKSVATTTLTSNGTLAAKSEYTYDSKGRASGNKIYADATHYTQQEFSYGSAAQPTQVKTLNVKTADGALATGSPGYSDGVIAQKATYNERGLQTSAIDGNGNTTSIEYDVSGRIIKVTRPDGAYASYSYSLDPTNGISSVTYQDEGGNQYIYKYDPFGRLQEVYDLTAGRALQNRTYDSMGNLALEVTRSLVGADQRTYYYHDYEGRLLESGSLSATGVKTPLESYVYKDGLNQIVHTVHGETNAPAATTTTTMDNMGYVINETRTLGTSTYTDTYTNNYLGNCVQYKSAYTASIGGSFTTRAAYDYAGRTTAVTNALNQTVAYGYDWQGNQISTTDPKGTVSANSYDALGRLLQTTQPIDASASGATRYTYDANGNVTCIQTKLSDSPQRWSRVDYSYNNRDLLIKTTSHASESVAYYTQYYYDAMENPLRMYTGLSAPLTITGLDQVSGGSSGYSTTKYTYDRFGNQLTMTDSLGQIESKTYDLTGAVLSETDRNGTVTSYTYDTRGRLLNRTATPTSGSPASTTYTYSVNGRTLSESDGTTTTNFVYDAWGRMAKETTGTTVKSYSYNSGNLRTSFSLTQGGQSRISNTYTHDALGRLTKVSGGGAVANYTYDANSNLSKVTYGNGVAASFSYNKANLVTQVCNAKGSAVLSQYDYTYDLAGQQLTKTDHTGRITSYTYDDLGQLLSETQNKNGVTISQLGYQYDASFNRSTKTESGGALNYQHDLNNRLTATTQGEVNGFTYSSNGNMLTWNRAAQTLPNGVSVPAKSISYGYDAENRLTSVSGSASASYVYGPNDLRTSKTVGSVTTGYTYDGDQLIYESTGTAYIRGLTLAASKKSGELLYYLYNAHGDVVQLTNSQGNVVQEYDYDAFGNEISPDAEDTNPFRYCGEYFDKETGLYYLRARYYSPALGRFTQEDTYIGELEASLSLNLYIYCGNNPILLVDSSGRSWEKVKAFGARAWNGTKNGVRWTLHGWDWVLSDVAGIDTAARGAAALQMFEDPNAKGVYHASFDCWQSNVGYNAIYDFFFDIGTSMKSAQFDFSSGGQEYRIWVWKGDYINLGAGAELGIYKQATVKGHKFPQWIVDKNLAMKMTLNLKNSKGTTIIDYKPSEKQWWITGFNSNYKNVKADNLSATYTVTFPEAMYNDFYNKFALDQTTKDKRWTFDSDLKTATLKF